LDAQFLNIYIPWLLPYWIAIYFTERLFVYLVKAKIGSGKTNYYLFQFYQLFGVAIPIAILILCGEVNNFIWDLAVFVSIFSYYLFVKLKFFRKSE